MKTDPAGKFELIGESITPDLLKPGLAESSDIALVLHTSGTTSRPKLVPLSQQNVCASARNVSLSLELTSTDYCLNIMPLFHIHGLIAAVLGSIHAGACVNCTPGFNALKFFVWFGKKLDLLGIPVFLLCTKPFFLEHSVIKTL
ncbi:MAG: hypothetical protein Ct9H300mP22_2820 [Gammaproteobacteria bacterium]|nr:MAG: hypothetical protein Ct9H300mP22_2820 [Gammaproteobacteria bacterium]